MSATAIEQPKPAVEKGKLAPVQHLKLVAVHLKESIHFAGGEETSLAIPRKVDRIIPARLEPTGAAVPISDNQRADGVLLVRIKPDLVTGKLVEHRVFVFSAGVRCLAYGE